VLETLWPFLVLKLRHTQNYALTNADLTLRVCDMAIRQARDKKTLKAIKNKLLELTSTHPNSELYYFSFATVYIKNKKTIAFFVALKEG
jgi:hypothetical protein